MTTWRRSTFSNNGSCVEVAAADNAVLVRNSNHPDRGTLPFDRDAVAAWIAGCKSGEFDDLG